MGYACIVDGIGDGRMTISFSVTGTPVPQLRPRFTRQGHAYDTAKCREYKKLVAIEAKKAMRGRERLEGALWCSLTFYMAIPKSLSQKKRRELTGAFVVKKPDTDNLAKSVMDSMIGIVYTDDAQIARLISEKRYGEVPRVEVMIDVLWEVNNEICA